MRDPVKFEVREISPHPAHRRVEKVRQPHCWASSVRLIDELGLLALLAERPNAPRPIHKRPN